MKTKVLRSLAAAALLAGAALPADAQYFEAGLHGGYGSTWLFNSNVSDQGDNLDYATSFAPIFGVGFGYYTASGAGIALEINSASVRQKYEGEIANLIGSGTVNFDVNEVVRYVEVPLLFRKYSKGGFFFEVGPKFAFKTGAEGEFDSDLVVFGIPVRYEDQDISDGYRSTVISGVLGIGGAFEIAPSLYLNARLRFAYGFNDATEEFSTENLLNQALDDENIGFGTGSAHYRQNGTFGYEATHSASGHLMLGVAYRFGEK